MSQPYSVKFESNIPLPLIDGTMTYADVFRPDTPGRFPALLQRTPYDKTTPLTMGMLDPLKAARHGFAVDPDIEPAGISGPHDHSGQVRNPVTVANP